MRVRVTSDSDSERGDREREGERKCEKDRTHFDGDDVCCGDADMV